MNLTLNEIQHKEIISFMKDYFSDISPITISQLEANPTSLRKMKNWLLKY